MVPVVPMGRDSQVLEEREKVVMMVRLSVYKIMTVLVCRHEEHVM